MLKHLRTDQVVEILDMLFEIDNSPTGELTAPSLKKKPTIRGSPRSIDLTADLSNDLGAKQMLNAIQAKKKSAVPNSAFKGSRNSIKLQPLTTDDNVTPAASPLKKRDNSTGVKKQPTQRSESGGLDENLEAVINLPSSLEDCTTSVQFVLMSLSLAFEMKPKQAAALLTNN